MCFDGYATLCVLIRVNTRLCLPSIESKRKAASTKHAAILTASPDHLTLPTPLVNAPLIILHHKPLCRSLSSALLIRQTPLLVCSTQLLRFVACFHYLKTAWSCTRFITQLSTSQTAKMNRLFGAKSSGPKPTLDSAITGVSIVSVLELREGLIIP